MSNYHADWTATSHSKKKYLNKKKIKQVFLMVPLRVTVNYEILIFNNINRMLSTAAITHTKSNSFNTLENLKLSSNSRKNEEKSNEI